MRMLAFTMALFTFSASAADFRALDIGQACAAAPEWELTHGSTLIPWNAGPGAEVYAFDVRQFDRRVLATYFCLKGELFTGNYSFPIEPLEEAVESYRDTYGKLMAIYGLPFVDSSPWNPNGEPRAVSPDPRKYMTNWRTERISVTISIMPNRPTESAGWRVFIVIGKPRSRADLTIGSSDRGAASSMSQGGNR